MAEADRSAWRRHLGEDVEAAELRGRLTAGTLPGCFAATAAERSDAPALDVDGAAATHGELDDRAARVAGFLRARGVAPGDRVLLCAPTSLDLVVAYLGTLRTGATAMPCDASLTADELAHLLGDARPEAAFVAPGARERLDRAAAGAGRVATVVAIGGSGDGLPALADALEARAVAPEPDPGPAMLAYTSGTTGRPKGVPLTHANVLASIRAAMLAWRWSANDVLVHALPLSHQHGLSGVHATLLAGSRAVVAGRFEPAALCAAIAVGRATVLFAVPAIYERLDAWEGIAGADLSSLRLAVSGSAPLAPALADRVAAWLRQIPLERYGSTEAGLDVSNPYDGPRRPGRVGWALPGVELRLDDDGEILLRGPQVFGGYWQRPEATAEALSADGWFRTGDLGRLDAQDGSLEITGRSKELIISGGLNVYPREVEIVLEEHPAVERVAVAGVPSERWGEEVVAFVVAAGALDAEALIALCRERLSAHKCPKRVVVLDEIPVNRMGKVRRDALAAMAGKGAAGGGD
ncbi:MAG TPA: class I adenylate-forming enzyme family protein [Solirubrobacteraceae bacterium]|nr:class I adenylate-forming enzyme family protein [Solirubrobacteraceae bacterium]